MYLGTPLTCAIMECVLEVSAVFVKIIDGINPALKPYVFSDKNYTPYSLRSTYICNLILDDKDIYTVAKLAGHTIAVCEKYYARIDMGKKAKEITDFDYGSTRSRNIETESY